MIKIKGPITFKKGQPIPKKVMEAIKQSKTGLREAPKDKAKPKAKAKAKAKPKKKKA